MNVVKHKDSNGQSYHLLHSVLVQCIYIYSGYMCIFRRYCISHVLEDTVTYLMSHVYLFYDESRLNPILKLNIH